MRWRRPCRCVRGSVVVVEEEKMEEEEVVVFTGRSKRASEHRDRAMHSQWINHRVGQVTRHLRQSRFVIISHHARMLCDTTQSSSNLGAASMPGTFTIVYNFAYLSPTCDGFCHLDVDAVVGD